MRRFVFIGVVAALAAGCLQVPPPFAEEQVLLVLVEQTYELAGSGTARASFGGDCAFGFRREPPFVAYTREAEGPVPAAVLVRVYEPHQPSDGAAGARVVPAERGRELYELAAEADVSLLSPFLTGPAVTDLSLRGTAVAVEGHGALAPGESYARQASYQLRQEGGAFHVVERLVVRNLGWAPAHVAVADDGACA